MASLSSCARTLGLNKGYLSKLSKLPWFPVKGDDGYDPEELRTAIAANVRTRKPEVLPLEQAARESSATTFTKEKSDAVELDAHERGLVEKLKNPATSALEKSEAGYALASYRVAKSTEEGTLGARDFDDMKKQSEELRRARQAQIELDQQAGTLISRSVAKLVLGELVGRLIGILNNFENNAGVQFEIWLGDEKFHALPVEERLLQMRSWFEKQTHLLRSVGADEIEALVVEFCKK